MSRPFQPGDERADSPGRRMCDRSVHERRFVPGSNRTDAKWGDRTILEQRGRSPSDLRRESAAGLGEILTPYLHQSEPAIEPLSIDPGG